MTSELFTCHCFFAFFFFWGGGGGGGGGGGASPLVSESWGAFQCA